MKAMICLEPGAPLIEEDVRFFDLGPNQVIVQTLASGVCHTDLSFAAGNVGQGATFPMVLGHEAVGRVVSIGTDVRACRRGDLVIASILPACGTCWHCVRDESQHCDKKGHVHTSSFVQRRDGSRALAMAGLGSFAEEMCVDERSLVPLHSDLPVQQLAMIGCGVTTGVGAVLWSAGVRPGSDVAVFGCGGVGQSAIQGARLAGARRIFAIDPAKGKRDFALGSGATDTIDPTIVDPVQFLRDQTGGRGVDYAFEITGIPAVAQQTVDCVRKRGTAVLVGLQPAGTRIEIPGRSFFLDEKRVIGSLYGSAQIKRDLETLVRFAEAGKLDLGAMVSNTIALNEVNEAFKAMSDGSTIRSVIVF